MLCSVREKKGSVLFFNLEFWGGDQRAEYTLFMRVGGWELKSAFLFACIRKRKKGHPQNDSSHTSLEEAQLYKGPWKTIRQALGMVKMCTDQTQHFQYVVSILEKPGHPDQATCVRTCTVQESEGMQTNR